MGLMTFYRRYANKWTFIALFCLCYSLESLNYTYLVSTLQSIERQFQITSKKSGFLSAANDIGYMTAILFLAYIGSRGNRAKWIGGGCLLISVACLLISTPHYIFPHVDLNVNATPQFEADIKQLLSEGRSASLNQLLNFPPIRAEMAKYKQRIGSNDSSLQQMKELNAIETISDIPILYNRMLADKNKGVIEFTEHLRAYVSTQSNVTDGGMSKLKADSKLQFGYCNMIVNSFKEGWTALKCAKSGQSNDVAYGIVFVGIMLIGVGHTLPFTLGIPLLDDNVKRKSIPLYFAGMFFIRLLGPSAGFLVGAACTKIYVTLTAPDGLTPKDPRWIGAWWLGYIILALILFFPSLILFMFPKKAAEKGDSAETTDFWVVLGQILMCPVYVGNLFGRCLEVFAWRGFFSYLPKFLHNHYGIAQYKVSLILAGTGIPSFAVGIVGGSFIMRKLKLEGRKAAAFVALGSLTSAISAVIQAQLVCDSAVGRIGTSVGNMSQACNADCFCDPVKLYPVCSTDGTPYYSPCIAGCTNMTAISGADGSHQYSFADCSCVDDGIGIVSKEFCEDNCQGKIIAYFVVKIIGAMIAGLTVITAILLTLRSVPPQHRSIALGFSSFVASVVSNFPSPIVYGSLVDTACLSWSGDCSGGKGSCLIYDSVQLIFKIHMLKASLQFLSLIFDAWVIYWAKDLKLLSEDEKAKAGSSDIIAAQAVDDEIVEDIVNRPA